MPAAGAGEVMVIVPVGVVQVVGQALQLVLQELWSCIDRITCRC